MSIISKIKESIITKWIVLYYTFFFVLGSYILLQLLFTVLQFFFFGDPQQSMTLQGFSVVIDGVEHQIWDLPQFHISIILSSIIIIAITLAITRFLMKGNPFTSLGFVAIKKEHVVWFIYSIIVLCVGILLREFVIGTTEIAITANSFIERILVILGLAIFGPILEEILFRGFLQSRMELILKYNYPWISIVVTAAMFAMFHFQYSPFEMLYIFAVGVFLSVMRWKTGSLWFPIVYHVTGNLYAVVTIAL